RCARCGRRCGRWCESGMGVAGAIRMKGGPAIQEDCDRLSPIAVGEAAITGGGNLKAKYVIHAASMGFSQPTTAVTLKASTEASLRICAEREIASVAFPALGTGVSGFSTEQCAEIMLKTAKIHLDNNDYPKQIEFVLWDDKTYNVFKEIYNSL
ncbi:macro domain-containing protein, partial [bacterium]|nr:macro domain-containing protein [bacterium]